ncbi:MAG: nuclease [Ruminococcaceae bacterium]|jgi:hypothetical protein|nr:nuclease [Oscillospiraceae bacterium]
MTEEHRVIRPDYARRIEAFRLLDDTFLSTVFDNRPKLAEKMLRIVLGRDDIEVLDVKAQVRIPNLLDHDLVLDILAQDANGKKYDIEVQRSSAGASPQRARYHLALIDARSLTKGSPFTDLRENYVIFFTEEDTRQKNLPLSEVSRLWTDTKEPFGDGSHILYVNGAYQPETGEETELTKLIHDFRCTAPEEMQIPEIAEQVFYYKRTEGGQEAMCRIMEEFAEEQREATLIETIKKLMENMKWTADQAMKAIGLPEEEQKKLREKL